MPRITVLRNLGAGLPDYKEGQTIDVSNEEAERLCGLKLAVLAEPEKPAPRKAKTGKGVNAVPASSKVAEQKKPEKQVTGKAGKPPEESKSNTGNTVQL